MPSPKETQRILQRELNIAGALGLVPSIAATSVGATIVPLNFGNELGLARLRLVTSAALTITLGGTGARAGGVKLADLPALGFTPLWSRIRATLSLTAGTATATAGELGLGTLVGSGGNATLGAVDAAAEDILEGVTQGNIAAGASITPDILGNVRNAIDGRSSADSIFLNYATTVGVATTNATVAAGAIIDIVGLFTPAA